MHLTWIQRYTKLCLAFCGIFAVFLLLIPTLLLAQSFNPEINYQGKLLDDVGAPVADGSYSMVFRLYTVSSGGTHIWTETQSVTVSNGLFSVMLGDVSSLASVNFNQTLYLGINVAADGEMTPRKVLGAVPAAFEAENAQTVGGIATSSFLRSDQADTLAATAATTLLTIQQNGAGNILDLFDGGTNVFTVRDGGNVGIGTTSPARTLVVDGDFELTGGIFDNNGTRGLDGYVLQTTGAGVEWVATSTLGFASAASAHDPVTLAGTPNYITLSGQQLTLTQLDLADDVATFASSVLAGRLTDETGTGNVVFSASPTFTGTALFSGATFTSATSTQFAIGSLTSGRIPYATTGGRLIDSASLTYNGTNLGLGATNGIAFGGTRYLTASTTNDSITFGEGAGALFNSGTMYNVALGFQAGGNTSSATGDFNVYAGYRAGYSNTGSSSILIGYQAGESNSASYNVAIGDSAGRNMNSTYNVFVGYGSGLGMRGSNNTAFGAETLNGAGSTVSVSNNVAIGYRAGYNFGNSSSNNTLIGYQAGDNITVGAVGNIVIGYDIDNPGGATTDYRLTIGNLIFGTSVDGTGTTVSSGNIGIGTSTPSSRLQVYVSNTTTASPIVSVKQNSTGDAGLGFVLGNANNYVLGIDNSDADKFKISYGATGNAALGTNDRLTIDTSGNVGIGTTTPTQTLTVAGGFRLTGAFRDRLNSAGTNGYILQSNGSGVQWVATSTLGIGGSNPFGAAIDPTELAATDFGDFTCNGTNCSFDADTVGDNEIDFATLTVADFTNDAGYLTNITNESFLDLTDTPATFTANRILYMTGSAVTSSANFTFDGTNLGFGNTQGIAWGGDRVLYASTTKNNYLFGLYAGSSITSGNNNTAIGTGALSSVTTGSDNIAIGRDAGTFNISGASNVFIGAAFTGYYNTTGSNNVFVGQLAGGNNDDGSYNTHIGNGAANTLRDGGQNSTLGAFAGFSLATSSGSTIIGYSAGFGLSGDYEASRLTILGREAGYNLQTGADNNILIGYNAANALTTGANNIVIGYDIDLQNNTWSNRLNIGNLIFGTGIDGTGTTLSSGNIGIGTTTPEAKFTIEGDSLTTGRALIGSTVDTDGIVNLGGFTGVSTDGAIGVEETYSNFGFDIVTSIGSIMDLNPSASNLTAFTNGITSVVHTRSGNSNNLGQVSGYLTDMMHLGSGSVSSMIGLDVTIQNFGGSITDTYGIRIGELSNGTRVNTPYAIYSSDADARSYFAGDFGIGTSTPTRKLTVAGTMNVTGTATFAGATFTSATSTQLAVSSLGTGQVPYATTSGRLIGSSNLTFTGTDLVFGGDAALTRGAANRLDVVTGDSLRIVSGSLQLSTDVSVSRGAANRLDLATGDSFNLVSGGIMFAGTRQFIVSGTNNVRIGDQAGDAATGQDNILMGVRAGEDNTGSDVVSIGFRAGESNSGDFNNLIGYFAGNANTGQQNNIFGYEAGYNNTGGDFNNLIGVRAGYSNNGDYNEMIGFEAGRNYRGTNSIVIGALAFRGGAGTTPFAASNNIAIGYRAGYSAQASANNNLLLGYQAADSLTTGTNNIIIGYDVEAPSNTGSNQLNIGNLIFGTGIDGVGTTLSSGSIGIGTSTPTQKLTVAGGFRLTGAFRDANNSAGTNGYVLQTTGTGVQWVATSSLGISGGGLAASSIDTSSELAAILTDETGTAGSVVFSASPTFTGVAGFAGATFTSATSTQFAISSLTSGRVPYATTGGRLIDSSRLTYNGTALTVSNSTTDDTVLVVNASALTTNVAVSIGAPASTNLSTGRAIQIAASGASFAGTMLYTDGSYGMGPGYATRDTFLSRSATSTLLISSNRSTGDANLTVTGFITTDSLRASANDSGALGASGTAWSDLFLASGAVINFNAGDVTLTHSADTLTVAGGTLVSASNSFTSATSTQLAVSSLTSGRVPYVGTGGRLIDTSFFTFANNGGDGRLQLNDTSQLQFGGDVLLSRNAANRLDLATGDSLNLVSGELQVAGTTAIDSSRRFFAPAGAAGSGTLSYSFSTDTNTGFINGYDSAVSVVANGSALYTFDSNAFYALSFYLNPYTATDPANPAYAFAADTNTGVFSPAADTVALTTGGSERLRVTSTGNVGIGTTTPQAKLSIGATGITGNATAGIDAYYGFTNSTASAVQYGNKTYIRTANTVATTLVGNMLRLEDSTAYANTVRGLEVQVDRGTNTLGENTAISGFGRTFGIRGTTRGDAGALFEPAGGYFETQGAAQGNAIRGYSGSITSASLMALYQDTTAFTGTGLDMNFGNTTGSFTGNFIDAQVAGVTQFIVKADGSTGIGATPDGNAKLTVGGNVVISGNASAGNALTSYTSTQIFDGSPGGYERAYVSAVYRGELYFGFQGDTAGEGDVWKWNGTATSSVWAGTQEGVRAMIVYNDRLYFGEGMSAGDGNIYYYNGSTVATTSELGAAHDWIADFEIFNGRLYALTGGGTADDPEVFRLGTDGVTWSSVSNIDAFTVSETGQLIVHNGQLVAIYYDATNYRSYSSADGTTWTAGYVGTFTGTPEFGISEAISYKGDIYFSVQGGAANDGHIYKLGTAGPVDVGAAYLGIALAEANGQFFHGYRAGGTVAVASTPGGEAGVTQIFNSGNAIVYDITEYNGDFYVLTGNGAGQGDVFKLTKNGNATTSYALQFATDSGYGYNATGTIWFESKDILGGYFDDTSGKYNPGTFFVSHSMVTNAGAYDVAEDYETLDTDLRPGELLMYDTRNEGGMTRADKDNANLLAGVVSARPGFLLSQADRTGMVATALVGRVPVTVNGEGGTIEVGDSITISSEPGIGARAAFGDRAIGYALSSFDPEDDDAATSTVTVFVTTHTALGITPDLAAMMADPTASSTASVAEAGTTFWSRLGDLVSNFVDGVLTLAGLKTDLLCVGDVCVTEDEFRAMVNQANVQSVTPPEPEPETGEPEPSPAPDPEPQVPEGEGEGGAAPLPEVLEGNEPEVDDPAPVNEPQPEPGQEPLPQTEPVAPEEIVPNTDAVEINGPEVPPSEPTEVPASAPEVGTETP